MIIGIGDEVDEIISFCLEYGQSFCTDWVVVVRKWLYQRLWGWKFYKCLRQYPENIYKLQISFHYSSHCKAKQNQFEHYQIWIWIRRSLNVRKTSKSSATQSSSNVIMYGLEKKKMYSNLREPIETGSELLQCSHFWYRASRGGGVCCIWIHVSIEQIKSWKRSLKFYQIFISSKLSNQ